METKKYTEKTFLFFGLFVLGLSLYLLYNLSDYGFDFTDEGAALNNIDFAYDLKLTFTHFGKIISPIFLLFKKDIVLLRKFNVFITYSIGVFLTYTCFRNQNYPNTFFKKNNWFVISNIFIIAGSSLNIITQMKMITPSYNSICFFGCCLLASGYFLISSEEVNLILVFFICTVGIVLLSMSKPTSAFLGIIYTIVYSFSFKIKAKMTLQLSCLIGSIITLFWLILSYEKSIFVTIDSLKETLNLYSTLGAGYEVKNIINSTYEMSNANLTQLSMLAAWTIANFLILKQPRIKINNKGMLLRNISSILLIISIVYFLIKLKDNSNFELAFYLSLPLTFIVCYLFYKEYRNSISKNIFNLSILMMIMPLCYSLGTDRNYWLHSKSAFIFFILSFIVLSMNLINKINNNEAKERIKLTIIIASLISILLTLNSILALNAKPWRQPDYLFLNKDYIKIGSQNSIIKVSKKSSIYLTEARRLMKNNNFIDKTPIIDLTGRSPGFIYAIGGKPIIIPWILGGHNGSDKFLTKVLDKVNCKFLNNAWVLTQPEERTAISNQVLFDRGFDITNKEQYKQVFKLDVSKISSKKEDNVFQYLYKPIKEEKINQSCKK